ncbi:hypothetical protein ACFW9I_22140 [[Kitasatospora] papulosa]|uniref:hypothetical protein n=1 Tax=[Kitasatospora] papulosa TaxID=1464011 RepID=UPI0036CAC187
MHSELMAHPHTTAESDPFEGSATSERPDDGGEGFKVGSGQGGSGLPQFGDGEACARWRRRAQAWVLKKPCATGTTMLRAHPDAISDGCHDSEEAPLAVLAVEGEFEQTDAALDPDSAHDARQSACIKRPLGTARRI